MLVDLLAATSREELVRSMARAPAYLEHWQDNLMDLTGVNRIGARANGGCYGESALGEDGPELAAFVRSNGAESDFGRPWTMYDLSRSAVLLDDLSPWFEADLYAHLVYDNPVMNISETEAIRLNLAELFQRNYLHREMACLPCHNSEASVTGTDNPETDRTWEVPGHFEGALFGASGGMEMNRLHGFFRRDGAIVGPSQGTDEEEQPLYDPRTTTPWGGEDICGVWGVPDEIREDRLELPVYFTKEIGTSASMWDLEGILREGLDGLRGQPLAEGADPAVDGPAAFATLLSLSVAERVWKEAFGYGLTLSHGFPRNQEQRDLLTHLASTWIAGDYSLLDLLVEVATHPYFALNAPRDVVESDTAYFLSPIFQPFSVEDEDPARHGNSVGDGVRRQASRTLLRAAYWALDWPGLADFPVGVSDGPGSLTYQDDAWIQAALGLTMKDSSSGFRSLDFQTLLAWESWFGQCTDPMGGGAEDWVDRLIAAGTDAGSTVEDVLSALKDRILTDPDLSTEGERAVLRDVLGFGLDERLTEEHEPGLRRVCGLWLSSPQFQLGGVPGPAGLDAPALVVAGSRYQDYCEAADEAMFDGSGIACSGDSLELR